MPNRWTGGVRNESRYQKSKKSLKAPQSHIFSCTETSVLMLGDRNSCSYYPKRVMITRL